MDGSMIVAGDIELARAELDKAAQELAELQRLLPAQQTKVVRLDERLRTLCELREKLKCKTEQPTESGDGDNKI